MPLSHPVALAAVPSKRIVLLLLIHCLLLLSLFVGVVFGPCFIMKYVLITFAIISLRMQVLVALLLLSSCCCVALSGPHASHLTTLWVDLQCVIVVKFTYFLD